VGSKFNLFVLLSTIVTHGTSVPKSYFLAFRDSLHRLSWLHIPQAADGTCAGVHEVALRTSLQWQSQSIKSHQRDVTFRITSGLMVIRVLQLVQLRVLNVKPSCSET